MPNAGLSARWTCLSPRAGHGERHVSSKGGVGIASASEPAGWDPKTHATEGRFKSQRHQVLVSEDQQRRLAGTVRGTPRAHSFPAGRRLRK
jgi:hypothetical protein